MPGVLPWGWDATNKKWIKLQVDANGRVKVDMSAIKLDDLANVSVASPTDQDLFYYDDATGLWKSRALLDADIPATIARDAEVAAAVAAEAAARAAADAAEAAARSAAIAAHAALTTGVHGLPSSYSGQAGRLLAANSGETALEFVSGKSFYPLALPEEVCHFPIASSTPRTATISAVSDDVITLTANEAYRFFHTSMEGNCYTKIANTSKSPTEYAWVKAKPANNQLQVTDADDISGWANTETISTQKNDTDTDEMEIDLTPLIGSAATGIFCRITVLDTASGVYDCWVSPDGAGGSWQVVRVQTANRSNFGFPFVPVDSNQHICVKHRASGVDTLRTYIHVQAYV